MWYQRIYKHIRICIDKTIQNEEFLFVLTVYIKKIALYIYISKKKNEFQFKD